MTPAAMEGGAPPGRKTPAQKTPAKKKPGARRRETADVAAWRFGERLAAFTIPGEPAAKGNSREIVVIGGRPRLRKGDKALAFEALAALYVPALAEPYDGDVALSVRVYYASRRPDLDSSLVRDALEGRVVVNDRQVRRVDESGFVDKERPRVDVRVFKAVAVMRPARTQAGGEAGGAGAENDAENKAGGGGND